jgi:hypothetical protein
MLLDSGGRLIRGDPSDVYSYPDYGADVIAVADGTVTETLGTLETKFEGGCRTLGPLTSITSTAITLCSISATDFSHFTRICRNSLLVKPGQRVKRAQILAKLGNTGNTSGPHLHFHIMDRPLYSGRTVCLM